jgi:S-(hydroxymethyl)glutathione dehydrogenase/alcohol dehydrogenase
VLPEIAVAKIREDAPFDSVLHRLRRTTGIGAVINTAKVEPGQIVVRPRRYRLNVIKARMAGANMIIGSISIRAKR